MELFPGESRIMKFSSIVLTSCRVRSTLTEGVDGVEVTSFLLSELRSCKLVDKSQPGLLTAAIAAFVAGFFGERKLSFSYRGLDLMEIGLIVAVFLVVMYFLSRQKTLHLCAGCQTISVDVTQYTTEDIEAFIDTIEEAKLNVQAASTGGLDEPGLHSQSTVPRPP